MSTETRVLPDSLDALDFEVACQGPGCDRPVAWLGTAECKCPQQRFVCVRHRQLHEEFVSEYHYSCPACHAQDFDVIWTAIR